MRNRMRQRVSEADVGLIKAGQAVHFTVDAYPEREFQGQVRQFRLNSSSSQGVVTYTIIVDVANPDELLKPGMTAQTRIVVSSKPKVTRLPTAALRFRPDEDSLKTKTNTKVKTDPASAASAPHSPAEQARTDDDGVLSASRAGRKLYRVYTVGDEQTPKLHEVTIGIANTRFTELLSGDLKAGDEVITRSAEPAGKQ